MKRFSKFLIIVSFLFNTLQAQIKSDEPTISKDVLSDIIKSLPNHFEVQFLFKDLSIPFKPDLLHPAKNTNQYHSNVAQALNFGLVQSDLAYLVIYDQDLENQAPIQLLEKLSKVLQIQDIFNIHSISQIQDTEMLYATPGELNTQLMDALNEQNRAKEAIIIHVGDWVASLYILCKINQAHSNYRELLENRIGEQKFIIEQLLLLLDFYNKDPEVKELSTDLEKLLNIYDQVKITYEYKEKAVLDEKGVLIIIDDTTSKLDFTPQASESILQTVTQIREKIIRSQ